MWQIEGFCTKLKSFGSGSSYKDKSKFWEMVMHWFNCSSILILFLCLKRCNYLGVERQISILNVPSLRNFQHLVICTCCLGYKEFFIKHIYDCVSDLEFWVIFVAFMVYSSLSARIILSWSVLLWILSYELYIFSGSYSVKWFHDFNLSSLEYLGFSIGKC